MLQFFVFLQGAARTIFAFILPIVKARAGKLLAAALPIAQQIVAGLDEPRAANEQMTNAEKHDVAFAQLKNALIAQGYATAADIGSSLLNLAIEMAVARLKAS